MFLTPQMLWLEKIFELVLLHCKVPVTAAFPILLWLGAAREESGVKEEKFHFSLASNALSLGVCRCVYVYEQ